MEKTQEIAVPEGPNQDGLAHIQLVVVEEILSQAREVGVSVLADRFIAVLDDAVEMVVVLHHNHIHSIDNANLDRGQVIPSLLVLDLLQGQGRSDHDITVIEITVHAERLSANADAHSETIIIIAREELFPFGLLSLFVGVISKFLQKFALSENNHLFG